MKYIDIHCHINSPDFKEDFEAVLGRARELELGMIIVGTNLETSKEAVAMAEKYPDMWAVVGLHPTEIEGEIGAGNDVSKFNYDEYKKLASNPKVVAIGECGFDYYWQGYETKNIQQEILEKQIELANEINKPLVLHIRNGLHNARNAYQDALDVLRKHARVIGHVHFFVGTWEEGKQFIELGFRLSFTGVITFIRDYDEVIKKAPINMIMSETDAPYVTPVPNRGKRNEPAFVVDIAKKIAEIRGESEEKISGQLVDNAKKLFSIE